jgi:hypothetical protein
MEAERLLKELCRRHGVTFEEGSTLLPMVQRALQSPREARIRLLVLVEQTLRFTTDGAYPEGLAEAAHDPNILMAVAKALHDWTPPEEFLGGAA